MRRETMRAIGMAAAVAAGLLIGPPRATAQDPAELLDRGKREFEAGDFASARTNLWAYLDATTGLTGPSRLPQAEALYTIALMEPDAGIAAQHYRTIVDEYAASSIADEALFRLAQLDLVEGRAEDARTKLQRLSVDYPFSRYQAEIPLWTGKAWLAEGEYRRATDSFIEGFTRIKRQDLPQELSLAQREALGAEYVYQLANAFGEEGDQRTSTQYYAMLALDYPDSPQAAEARVALGEGGEPTGEPVEIAQAPSAEPAVEEPPVAPAGGPPVYVPETGGGGEPASEAPDVVIEDARPRDETPLEEPPPVIIEDARPREEPRYEPAQEEPREEPRYEPAAQPPPVVIESARPREEPTREPETVWIQVGAFTSATNAAELSSRLKRDGFFPEIKVGVVDGQGYYRVRLGPFALPSAGPRLEESRRQLEARGYPARQVDD